MNPIPDIEPLFEAAEVFPDPDSVPTPSRRKAHPAPNAPLRFRHIERNQPTWMIVDLERMLDEAHPARAIWEFVGGLDLSRFEGTVRVKVGGASRDSWSPRLLISMWIYAYSRGLSSAREVEQDQTELGKSAVTRPETRGGGSHLAGTDLQPATLLCPHARPNPNGLIRTLAETENPPENAFQKLLRSLWRAPQPELTGNRVNRRKSAPKAQRRLAIPEIAWPRAVRIQAGFFHSFLSPEFQNS